MRVLIGPSDRPVGPGVRAACPDAEHEFLGFGHGAEIDWDPTHDEFALVLARLPAGWSPDLTIFCSPEYHPVPKGIENAPCVTATVIGDWNLGGQALHLAGPLFDILASDRNGCDRIRAAGFENVVYVPFFSHDPAVARLIPGVERDLDVVMIGNFHGEIQRERAPWVARVAALSRKHKVLLTSGVYGEEYARLMNRAKIVFNRSIRGEINMRVYEAAACGALVFYERDNREIRELFTEGEEVVLYGDDDLEDLLDYYLAHPEKRLRIAEAARRKVESHTAAFKTLDIARRIAAAAEGSPEHRRRVAADHEPARMAANRARQWLLCGDKGMIPRAVEELASCREASGDPIIAAAEGAALAAWADHSRSRIERARLEAQALARLEAAIRSRPASIAARLQLALLLRQRGDRAGATGMLLETVRALEEEGPARKDLDGPLLPRVFDAEEVDTEWTWATCVPGSPDWRLAMTRIYRRRAHEMLATGAFEEADFAEALRHAGALAALAPDRGPARALLARCLRVLGRVEEAVSEYSHAIRLSPLDMGLRVELALLQADTGQTSAAETVIADALHIIDGAPCFEDFRAELSGVTGSRRIVDAVQRGRFTLLAFPDWSNDVAWQGLIEAYALCFAVDDAVTLRLRVCPETCPPVHAVVGAILEFAEARLGLTSEQLPDIDIAAEPLSVEDRWKLFVRADALVSLPGSAENIYAEARSIPVISPHDLSETRALFTRAANPRSDSIPCLST